jgi:hypothetical protein
MLETENMNADQGSGRAPGNFLRVAALTTAAQAIPDVSPAPAAPEAAKACDLAVGQVAISAALLFFSVTALSAVAGRRQADGKRGAAHARTSGRRDENGNDAGQPGHDGQRPQHADDYPSWPGRPGPYALHPDHPSWGGGRTDPRWDSTEAGLAAGRLPQLARVRGSALARRRTAGGE